MITISFKPKLQVPLRKRFLENLAENGLTPEKKMFPKDDYIEYEVKETIAGKEHGKVRTVFKAIVQDNYGCGFPEDAPLGCTVFAKSTRDTEMNGTSSVVILYWALPPKKVRKKKVKEIDLGSLADSIF
jgi:hypothetical protein